MYINYVNDRKQLKHKVVKNSNCGIKLVFITDSAFLVIRNFPSNVKGKSQRIILIAILGVALLLSNAEPAGAKGNCFLPGAEGFT